MYDNIVKYNKGRFTLQIRFFFQILIKTLHKKLRP